VLGTDAPTDELAPDQLAAVTHRSGPARIIAPAGSGKTRVLTARLRHLLRDRHVEPELVTAVAYNTRAAAEMRERTADLSGGGPRCLDPHPALAGAVDLPDGREREIIDERQQRAILDRLVRTARIPNQDPYQPYLEALSEVRLGLRDPAAVEVQRGDVDDLPEVFADYREELARRGQLDFDEQIYHALELLLRDPDLRAPPSRSPAPTCWSTSSRTSPPPSCCWSGSSPAVAAGVRRRRRRPDHLLLRRRDPRSPRRLRPLVPRRAHHALEVNYRCPRRSSTRPSGCCRTTGTGCRRRSEPTSSRSRVGSARE
jgi:hypothetical protein